MSRPFGLIEFVTRVGEDNVRVQPLVESVTNIRRRKPSDSVVTFVTSQEFLNPNDFLAERQRYIGLVLWIPRELVEQARAAHQQEA